MKTGSAVGDLVSRRPQAIVIEDRNAKPLPLQDMVTARLLATSDLNVFEKPIREGAASDLISNAVVEVITRLVAAI